MADRDAVPAGARRRPARRRTSRCATRPANGWPERRGTVAALAEELRRGLTPTAVRRAVAGASTGTASAGSARAARSRCSSGRRASTAQLVAPTRNRYTHRIPRGRADRDRHGRRRRRADPAADGARRPSRVPLPRRRRLHLGRRRRPGVERRPRGPDRRAGRHRHDPRGERPGAVPLARRAALLAAAASTCSRRGCARIHLVTAGQVPDWLDRRPPAGARWSTTPRSCRPTRCRRSTRTRSRPRCTTSPDLAEHFVYLNDDFFLGRPLAARGVVQPGRAGRGVLRPQHDRPRPTARRGAVPQGGVEQPPAAPGGLRRRVTTNAWPTRRTPTALGARRRSSERFADGSRRPRARRSAPTPTCRC